jgi:esterase/lipase
VSSEQWNEGEIHKPTYDWSIRIFRNLKKLLGVNIKLHHNAGQLQSGQIFLFNHFARFETFIPQYLFYEETGTYCNSVASSEFFDEDDLFANYLRKVGAIPHDHDQILPLLAKQILTGKKVIIFPEGGMVKDKKVLDQKGNYSIYSRIQERWRKQHTGAAVLALGVDAFKIAVTQAYESKQFHKLEAWAQSLEMDEIETLITAARTATQIVPSNITFYPIRVDDNLLRKGVASMSDGLSRRHTEELLIEGNLLFKDTDMDVRLGSPITPENFWRWWERGLLRQATPRIENLDELFTSKGNASNFHQLVLNAGIKINSQRIRDQYMREMYTNITVNLSHLAATIIMQLLDAGTHKVSKLFFHKALYLAIKKTQRISSLFIQRSLQYPDVYRRVINGSCRQLERFIAMAESIALIEPCEDCYQFLPKLCEEQSFDQIRTENLIAVYANEVAPLATLQKAVTEAMHEAENVSQIKLAELYFNDEIISWKKDKARFSKPEYKEINLLETATESPEPFILFPKNSNGVGIILVHGFLSSPAEVRGLAERLLQQGYTVIAPRLLGHGTSPWDLRERNWEDWLNGIRRAHEILSAYTKDFCLVGFSTGGALALRFAADQPDGLIGVSAVSVPIKFKDKGMMLISLLHGSNKIVNWLSSYEGLKPFITHQSEHPHINYASMPVKGLYELRRIVSELEDRLKDVHCRVQILQGNNDPTVDPQSADIIYKELATANKAYTKIESDKHGILYDDIDQTQQKIIDYLNWLVPGH